MNKRYLREKSVGYLLKVLITMLMTGFMFLIWFFYYNPIIKLPFYEKLWLQIRNVLGFHFKIKWKYIFIGLGVFVLLSLFNNRYQVVREVPFLNGVYKAFGVKAKIAGEGLEFQNINWNLVDENLALQREYSKQYLITNLL